MLDIYSIAISSYYLKYQTIFSALFFGSSFADAASNRRTYKYPRCVFFDKIKMAGGAELINTNGRGFPDPITSGDMIIGEYTGVEGEGVPTQFNDFSTISVSPVLNVIFEEIVISYKSVCIVTKDQFPMPSPPTCSYEFDLRYCPNGGFEVLPNGFETGCRNGRFTAHGSGPDKLRIAGGSDDFFGAFGQIKTPNRFDIGEINPNTGDLLTSSIDMIIELCFYDVK